MLLVPTEGKVSMEERVGQQTVGDTNEGLTEGAPKRGSFAALRMVLTDAPGAIVRFVPPQYERGGVKAKVKGSVESPRESYKLIIDGFAAAKERLTLSLRGRHPLTISTRTSDEPRVLNLLRGEHNVLPTFDVHPANEAMRGELISMGARPIEGDPEFLSLSTNGWKIFDPMSHEQMVDPLNLIPGLLKRLLFREAELATVKAAIKSSRVSGKKGLASTSEPRWMSGRGSVELAEPRGSYDLPCAVYELDRPPTPPNKVDIKPATTMQAMRELFVRRESLTTRIVDQKLDLRLLVLACERGEMGDVGWQPLQKSRSNGRDRALLVISGTPIVRTTWNERIKR